ncbi:MAG: glycosyltransferase 87 family protein [Anaerolineae bacterium]
MARQWRSWDLYLFLLLLAARARIDTLAELVFPGEWHRANLARLPLVGAWLAKLGPDRFFDWPTDLTLLVPIVLAFACLGLYGWADACWAERKPLQAQRVKVALVGATIFLVIGLPTVRLMALRAVAGPASYTHDGGVIQTEAATAFFLQGRNPYLEDYTATPLADWGIQYHTALYHYPYGPWTFLASAPLYALGRGLLGWYDQRVLYLLLFALLLALAAQLPDHPRATPALVMLLGLNPILGSDVIFGQNDVFVLFWLVLTLWLLKRRQYGWASAWCGLACASKPTAWFILPFYALYLAGDATLARPIAWDEISRRIVRRGWPVLLTFLGLMLPYLFWSPGALWDDIWGWSSGTSAVPYQVRGWGLSTLLLGLGVLPDRMGYFPFWILQVAFGVPVLFWLLGRQFRENALGQVYLGYAALLYIVLFFSRFLNENYVGFLAAVAALGLLVREPEPTRPPRREVPWGASET